MDWKIENNKLIKNFELADFKSVINFTNLIAEAAEAENHHPDILIYDYKKIKVSLFTHDEEKITEKDYQLAEKIDKIFISLKNS